MDIREYKLFLEIAQTNNFSETARENYITKSAIVQHVNKLEKKLGVTLFKRTSHGVKLTEAGTQLVPLAQQLVKDNDLIIQKMHNLSNTITIGTIFLEKPVLLTQKLNDSPELSNMQINFREVKSVKNINDQIDLIEYYEVNEYLDQSFNFFKLQEQPICIALPPTHPLAQKRTISIKDLEGYNVAIESDGVSTMGDEVKEELSKDKKINLKSFGIYNSAFFATAQYNKYLICLAEGMASSAKPYVIRPLEINKKAYYGIYYRKQASQSVKKFLCNAFSKANK